MSSSTNSSNWPPPLEAIRAERERRFRRNPGGARERVLATRFKQQRALIESKRRRRAGFCPRRSGKTEANVGLILDGALSGADHLVLFVAVTRQRAYDLTWRAVERACADHGIESKPNESRYERSFPNGSLVRWVGADDVAALRTKRGDKLWRVIIDEAQDFDLAILRELAFDIFGPSLEDLGGDLILTGTPGKVCAGFWYGVTVPADEEPDPLKRVEGWEVHRWTPADNPHVPRIHERLKSGEIASELGGEDSPTFQREWRGRWVRDTGALFYRFDPTKNLHDLPLEQLVGDGWAHSLGWDIGLNDGMGLTVWAFHRNDSCAYEAWSWEKAGALIDEVAEKVRWAEQKFDIVGKVADTGGGGAVTVAEMEKRHSLHFEAAKKTEKAEYARLLSDDFKSGKAKLKRGSPYAQQIAVLPKVLNWDEEKTGRPAPEDPRFKNENCDAGLYSWRWTMAYLHEPKKDKPPAGSPEWAKAEEDEMFERAQEEAREQTDDINEWI